MLRLLVREVESQPCMAVKTLNSAPLTITLIVKLPLTLLGGSECVSMR